VTQRIATTGSMPNFLESVNSEVVSTLLAKKIVLLSRKLESVDDVLDHLYPLPPRQPCRLFLYAQQIVIHFFRARRDKTITNIVSACGTKEKDRRNYSLPEAVAPIPKQYALAAFFAQKRLWSEVSVSAERSFVCAFLRSLYLLRRGPMLAPILQHADDIDYVRCLFLNSNLEDSLRLINPPLYLARQGKVRSNPLGVMLRVIVVQLNSTNTTHRSSSASRWRIWRSRPASCCCSTTTRISSFGWAGRPRTAPSWSNCAVKPPPRSPRKDSRSPSS